MKVAITRRRVVTVLGLGVVAYLAYRVYKWRKLPPDGRAQASSYVMKNGACYRVDFFADGSSKSSAVDNGLCGAESPDFEDSLLPDPDVGFGGLFHLFDDFDT